MFGRKLFKTKLCVLYQKGRCTRPSCSFAHGSAELRRFDGVLDGRQEYRGNDLRHKLDNRHSPMHERESRGRHGHREYSASWSLDRQSDRKRRKREHGDSRNGDSRNDYSEKLREDRSEEPGDGKISSFASRDTLEGQLNKMQADIEIAERHKHQSEVYLDEKIQEVDSLTSRIQELEAQLYKEKEECRRIKSKIKKFVKAHNRYSRVQDELKRSQVRLQELGDQLGSDVNKTGANEEDSSINIVSDGEDPVFHAPSPVHDLQKDNSSSKKQIHVVQEIAEKPKRADLNKGSKEALDRLRRLSRWNAHPAQSVYGKIEAVGNDNSDLISTANESRQKRGKSFTSVSTADKVRNLESGVVVPLTSMAAHAVDEETDIELEGNDKVNEPMESTKEAGSGSLPFLPLPPPPPFPFPAINHSRYESEDQNVDVVALDDEKVRFDNA